MEMTCGPASPPGVRTYSVQLFALQSEMIEPISPLGVVRHLRGAPTALIVTDPQPSLLDSNAACTDPKQLGRGPRRHKGARFGRHAESMHACGVADENGGVCHVEASL